MPKKIMIAFLCAVLFAASPAMAADDQFRFVVLGDSRGSDNGVNAAILAELVTAITAENADLVLFNGDLVNNGTQTQLETWVTLFMDPLAAAGVPVYACRGNHDADISAWNTVFTGAHAFPANGPTGEQNLTYSFEYKNALFISLEQYLLTNLYRINQPWLDDQLAQNTQPHIFVYGHVPAFAVDHQDCLASFPSERNTFWDSLSQAGAKLYFCGHDHFYDHAKATDSQGRWLHQFIVGSAGAPLYDWSGAYSESPRVQPIAHYKQNGYEVVDVDGYNVTLHFKIRVAPSTYEPAEDDYTYVSPTVLPRAAFSSQPILVHKGDPVSFTDESSEVIGAPITSWLWNFGDGSTSTQPDPTYTYTYTHDGSFTVSLTVTNAYGSDTTTHSAFNVVSVPALQTAGVLAALLIICSIYHRIHAEAHAAIPPFLIRLFRNLYAHKN